MNTFQEFYRDNIVPSLMNQLKVGGRMIIPIGDSVQQKLKVIVREEMDFKFSNEDRVMFVPLQEGIVT